MKKIKLTTAAIFAYCLLHTACCFSQGTAINKTGATADNSAMLDVSDTTKGILIPRMKKTNKLSISSPATGLMIYQTDDTTGFWYYNGMKWILLTDGSSVGGGNCPSGFTSVNSKFCIETNERVASNWYNAINTCISNGYRLCSWGEWYYACSSISGLSNMTNNFEWLDDSGYDSGGNGNSPYIIGSGTCITFQIDKRVNSHIFRCCYSK